MNDWRPTTSENPSVTIVHDYITQRGGAERVVLSMLAAFPGAPVRTSLYEPSATFPEFASADLLASPLNRSTFLRRHHRLAFPLLAPTFSAIKVESEIAICSSSGWAHGIRASGRKIVYCHTPARWLYQSNAYLGPDARLPHRMALALLGTSLRGWDSQMARTADRYLTNSRAVRERIRRFYNRDAEVLPPPPSMSVNRRREPIQGLEAGYWLCVSRLLPYKNVGAIQSAFRELQDQQLVIVGMGPELAKLRCDTPMNVRILGSVSDAELHWLYANCQGLISASYEDFGLTPLEAAIFGKPSVVVAWGGFLDTVVEELNGLFFSEPDPVLISRALRQATLTNWSVTAIQAHARHFDQHNFTRRLHEIVSEEAAQLGAAT